MKAMVLERVGSPLSLQHIKRPTPHEGELLIAVHTCGVCRTDLHVIDGELPSPKLPLVLGHQIVGIIEKTGKGVSGVQVGDRVGVPWLGRCCLSCDYCLSGRENLCDKAEYTGYRRDGGFAEYCVADSRFCLSLPERYPDVAVTPLLCAGLIGYRAYRKAGEGLRIGFYGFGSSAHILIQLACAEGREVYVFTREGDHESQQFAREKGAVWAGSSLETPPELLDSAIIFASDGALVVRALEAVRKGGNVVCAGIHMSDIPRFPYSKLWGERSIHSIANLTRRDGNDFLSLAPNIPIITKTTCYPLEQTNAALNDLRNGKVKGSAVIIVKGSLLT